MIINENWNIFIFSVKLFALLFNGFYNSKYLKYLAAYINLIGFHKIKTICVSFFLILTKKVAEKNSLLPYNSQSIFKF